MAGCCDVDPKLAQKKQILIIVLVINAVMFFAQFISAMLAHSTSLLADSLDMLGDAITYGLSLYAVAQGGRWLARASLFKGIIIAIFGIAVLVEALYKISFTEVMPHANLMVVFGTIGLIANGVCFYLLSRHRHQDINMRSTWICARNDIIGNFMVLITAGLVVLWHSRWPDIIVGVIFSLILIYFAIKVINESRIEIAKNSSLAQ